jgi:hypothetical protein
MQKPEIVTSLPEMSRSTTIRGNDGFVPAVHGSNEQKPATGILSSAPFDPIARPVQYNQGKIEVWDFILDQDLGFLAANVIKYVCRYRFKGSPIQDLKKARAYLDKLIATEEAKPA